jgi:hypothetical protein
LKSSLRRNDANNRRQVRPDRRPCKISVPPCRARTVEHACRDCVVGNVRIPHHRVIYSVPVTVPDQCGPDVAIELLALVKRVSERVMIRWRCRPEECSVVIGVADVRVSQFPDRPDAVVPVIRHLPGIVTSYPRWNRIHLPENIPDHAIVVREMLQCD